MSLRPNEFIEFLKGMALGVEDVPSAQQWKIILQKLMEVEKDEDSSTIRELTKEVERIVKPFTKRRPGSPPDIFF